MRVFYVDGGANVIRAMTVSGGSALTDQDGGYGGNIGPATTGRWRSTTCA